MKNDSKVKYMTRKSANFEAAYCSQRASNPNKEESSVTNVHAQPPQLSIKPTNNQQSSIHFY